MQDLSLSHTEEYSNMNTGTLNEHGEHGDSHVHFSLNNLEYIVISCIFASEIK